MKNTKFLENVSRTFHKVGFEIKKHSPAILIGVGVVGIVTSTVLACKATTKVEGIIKKQNETVDRIHELESIDHLKETGEYTEKDAKKDLIITYVNTGKELVKLYAPSVIIGSLSIASIVWSHNILNKRNLALASAYAVVDTNFKDYRKRVKERYGDKVDFDLLHNIKAEKVQTVVVDENGEEKVEEKTVDIVDYVDADGNTYTIFSRFFDELNPNWVSNAEKNLVFLKQCERYANDRLRLQGYLFLNDVYDLLGFEHTDYGQLVGWKYDPTNPDIDNYVDFGIYDVNKRRARDFVNGYEKAILLDFNVTGNILTALKNK